MTEKAVRIVRDYGNCLEVRGGVLGNYITTLRGSLEVYFAEYLATACADLLSEAAALPMVARILPAELVATIQKSPEGQTLLAIEKLALVILRYDSRQALAMLDIVTPADIEEFHVLKYLSFINLLAEVGGAA
jgi:hypothetical protein